MIGRFTPVRSDRKTVVANRSKRLPGGGWCEEGQRMVREARCRSAHDFQAQAERPPWVAVRTPEPGSVVARSAHCRLWTMTAVTLASATPPTTIHRCAPVFDQEPTLARPSMKYQRLIDVVPRESARKSIDWILACTPFPLSAALTTTHVRIGQRVFCRVRHKWCRVTSSPTRRSVGRGPAAQATGWRRLDRGRDPGNARSGPNRPNLGTSSVSRGASSGAGGRCSAFRGRALGKRRPDRGVVREGRGSDEVEGMEPPQLDRKSKLSKRLGLKHRGRWAVGG